jgi:hypothetical protein
MVINLKSIGLLPCTIKGDGGIITAKVVVVEVKLVDITKS